MLFTKAWSFLFDFREAKLSRFHTFLCSTNLRTLHLRYHASTLGYLPCEDRQDYMHKIYQGPPTSALWKNNYHLPLPHITINMIEKSVSCFVPPFSLPCLFWHYINTLLINLHNICWEDKVGSGFLSSIILYLCFCSIYFCFLFLLP